MRCAIYTRKSTDEGLDKQFNTLEAQREAGENYIKSQQHQGWEGKVPTWAFLRAMLSNRVYIGEITHKGTSFPGLHQPIINKEIFEAAQNLFKSNTQKIRRRHLRPVAKNEEIGLLRGILSCGCCGQKLYPRYSLKQGKRYYYYTDNCHKKYGPDLCRLSSVPMHLLDSLVMDLLNPLIKSPYALQALAQEACQVQANLKESEVFYAMREIDSVFQQLTGTQKEKIVSLLVQGVTIFADKIVVVWKPLAIHLMDKRLKASLKPNESKPELMESAVPIDLITHRGAKEIHLPETVSDILYLTPDKKPPKKEDRFLIKILANGFTYRETQEAKNLNLHELAEIYHQDPAYIGAQIRLTYLAPDIIDAILRGTQPKTMTAKELLRASIPASWPEQRKLFGFPEVKD